MIAQLLLFEALPSSWSGQARGMTKERVIGSGNSTSEGESNPSLRLWRHEMLRFARNDGERARRVNEGTPNDKGLRDRLAQPFCSAM
jgi:hypothetical protein